MDYPEEFKIRANQILDKAKIVFSKYQNTVDKDTLVALDWAGIGDALCHTRLILQHLVNQYKSILWISKPSISEFFRDDKMIRIVPGFDCNEYRGVGCKWVAGRGIPDLDNVFKFYFPNNPKLHVGDLVCKQFAKGFDHFSDLFFTACKVNRDINIKHSITHFGKTNLEGKYIVIEPLGGSGRLDTEECSKLSEKMSSIGYKTIALGSLGCPDIPKVTVFKELPLYDSFSIIKGSKGFVGRSSGNQSFMCFLHGSKLPLFEVSLNPSISYKKCMLYDLVISTDGKFSDIVFKYFSKQNNP